MINKPRLEGKVGLITGGASGIGEAAARLFLKHGARVVIADVQDDLGRQMVASCDSPNISYVHCDVRDEGQVAKAVAHALSEFGGLDVLFSNAGVMEPMTSMLDMDLEAFDTTMAINVRGVAATIKHAARAMVDKRVRGSIVCIASVAATVAGPGPHGYTVSKHAMLGLMKTACNELGAHGIRVNCISPFAVGTPLTCKAYGQEPSQVEANFYERANLKGVVLKPSHVAEAALFLASDESAYVSGQNLGVDGGFSVVSHSYKVVN